jgi:hypothetical protein
LQGCDGDLDEWVVGINDTLTEAGILKDDSIFKNISLFEHNGMTNLLFHMDDEPKLDVGKLAMWRLQTHEACGGIGVGLVVIIADVSSKHNRPEGIHSTDDICLTGRV